MPTPTITICTSRCSAGPGGAWSRHGPAARCVRARSGERRAGRSSGRRQRPGHKRRQRTCGQLRRRQGTACHAALRRSVPISRPPRRSGGEQPCDRTTGRSRPTSNGTRTGRATGVSSRSIRRCSCTGTNSEGESLERMVIRSNWNADPQAYLTTPDFSAAVVAGLGRLRIHGVNERHAVPPKSSQLQCEQHGLFDALLREPSRDQAGLWHCRP